MKKFDWETGLMGMMVALMLVSCALLIIGLCVATFGTVKDPDLRREQAKRDAWRLYMEASK